MANWQDYLMGGGGGAASGAATGGMIGGPWGALAGGVIGGGLGLLGTYKRGQGADSAKATYDQAIGETGEMSREMRDFLDQRRAESLGFYKPMQDMFNRTYGKGLDPYQSPQVPGSKPLDGMYGKGGR